MKYIDADKLINSNYLVKTPINKLNNKIINSEDKNILLIGKSGSGKTVTLKYMEKLSMNKNYKVIYTRFESIINLAKKEPNELYSKEFFDHYYEINFCIKLLKYIKQNFGDIYESKFKNFEKEIYKYADEMDYYRNNIMFNDVKISSFLNTADISMEIVKEIKKQLDCNNLMLEIDSFDYTNGASKYTQTVLSSFFPLFEKVILGVENNDDDSIFKEMKCNYSNYYSATKEILSKRIKYSNSNLNKYSKYIDEKLITDEIYKYLIKKCNGNITLMLNVIDDAINMIYWKQDLDKAELIFKSSINKKINDDKKIKAKILKPKLYI